MTIDAYITIAILVLTFGLLIRTKLPPVLIFLGALTLTITFRLAPLKESLKGFSNPGVLEVDDAFFYENRNEVEFSTTKRLTGTRIQRTDRAIVASIITAGMVTTAALGWMSMLNAALLASGLMLMTGCMTLGAAGRSVEFKTLIVIASAIGLEAAVTNSGLSGVIANALAAIGGDNPHIALAVVFIGCILMDTLTTNVASAALMFPIALAIAGELGVNFMPFAIVLMIGASCSFISPMGYAANLMVYEPGGYKFIDYAKVGIPLSILVGIVTVLLAPVFFKL